VAAEYLDYPRPLAFAHRGGAGHRPENSWRAFEHAAQLGYAHLETDTRSTADGKLIAFHDAQLDRATDRSHRNRQQAHLAAGLRRAGRRHR
jgi:glycerophosphoryl diester phosphodiesterase